MVTVGYLKKVLANIDDNALAYAYEGEVVGIIIVSDKKSDGVFNDCIMVIRANEDEVIQDGRSWLTKRAPDALRAAALFGRVTTAKRR